MIDLHNTLGVSEAVGQQAALQIVTDGFLPAVDAVTSARAAIDESVASLDATCP